MGGKGYYLGGGEGEITGKRGVGERHWVRIGRGGKKGKRTEGVSRKVSCGGEGVGKGQNEQGG